MKLVQVGIICAVLIVSFGIVFYLNSMVTPEPYYAVACLNALTYQSGNTPFTFDHIPLKDVSNASGTPAYTNPDSDVVAKLICAQGHLPEDPNAFYEAAVKSPYYWQIQADQKNYELILKK